MCRLAALLQKREDVKEIELTLNWNRVDCGHEVFHIFMVTDELWAEAGYQKQDLAHATCLAVRLKRPLRPKDFIFCLANDVADSMRKNYYKHTPTQYWAEMEKERAR